MTFPEHPVDINDVDSVASGLVSFGRPGFAGGRSAMRMRAGTYCLQFTEDTEHALVVTVQQFPRTIIPLLSPAAICRLEGLDVLLVKASYAVYLELTFAIAVSALREAGHAEHSAALDGWLASSHGHSPPEWPIMQMARRPLAVTDDLGTQYECVSGAAGGTGAEWVTQQNFSPCPPPGATALYLKIPGDEGASHILSLPLPV